MQSYSQIRGTSRVVDWSRQEVQKGTHGEGLPRVTQQGLVLEKLLRVVVAYCDFGLAEDGGREG